MERKVPFQLTSTSRGRENRLLVIASPYSTVKITHVGLSTWWLVQFWFLPLPNILPKVNCCSWIRTSLSFIFSSSLIPILSTGEKQRESQKGILEYSLTTSRVTCSNLCLQSDSYTVSMKTWKRQSSLPCPLASPTVLKGEGCDNTILKHTKSNRNTEVL